MSQFSYTTKPDLIADSAVSRTGYSAANIFPSRHGWVGPAAGMGKIAISAISGNATIITVTATAHGLATGGDVIITRVTTTTAYNNYYENITVTGVNSFTIPSTVTGVGVTTSAFAYKAIEVLSAIGQLAAVYADAIVVPTFGTGVMTYSGTAAVVTGGVVTLTITSSEPVEFQNSPQVALTINGTVRQMVLHSSSTSSSLVFRYTAVAGDVAIAGQVSIATTTNKGYISDILPENKRQVATLTFIAPNVSTVTFN